MSESEIQAKFLKWCSDKDWIWVCKYPGGTYGKAGTPDTLMSVLGIFLAIEFKTQTGKQSEIQKYEQLKIRMSGSISEVARSLEEAIAIVETVKEMAMGIRIRAEWKL